MRWGTRVIAAVGAVAAALASVVGLAAPAGAKGIESVTITGPGIELRSPIEVSGGTHPDEWEDIFTSSGIQQSLPDLGASALAPKAVTEHLGPRHTLTWHVMTGPDELTPVRQDLYLYADGGPLTYTAPDQPIWDSVTRGGWFRAPASLRQALADACVPIIGDFDASTMCEERQRAAMAKSANAQPAKTVSGASGRPSDSAWPEAVAGAAAAVVLAGLGGAVAFRRSRTRRRERVAPVPL